MESASHFGAAKSIGNAAANLARSGHKTFTTANGNGVTESKTKTNNAAFNQRGKTSATANGRVSQSPLASKIPRTACDSGFTPPNSNGAPASAM